MAQIFLSYDREDASKARGIAQALEKAGHSVWWDRHIKGGAQYAEEIEAALKAADAVVVLWSQQSVKSAWVRDEAGHGRDRGRLVPVSLDGTEPPLGFRQFQSIDLSEQTRRLKAQAIRRLTEAIASCAGQAPTRPTSITPAESPRRRHISMALPMALAAAFLAAAALMLWSPWGESASVPVVSIRAADSSLASKGLSRDLLIKLGNLQTARTDYVRLTEAASNPDLIVEAGSNDTSAQVEAQIALFTGKDRSLLWSQQFVRPRAESGDLRHEAAITAARVLGCALEVLNDKQAKLDQDVFKLYLNGCARYHEVAYGELRQVIAIMREVTSKAPRFSHAWGKLIQAQIVTAITGPPDSTLLNSLRRDVAAARRTNPHLAEAYLGEIELLPTDAYGARLNLVDVALRHNPGHADSYAARAHYLRVVGRMSESVDSAKRASELDPLSPALLYDYVTALSHAGQLELAEQELRRAERMWPGSSIVADSRYRFDLRYGDPKAARRSQPKGATLLTPRFTQAYVDARIDPSPANVDRAIREAETIAHRQPRGLNLLVQTMAQFGREDRLFALLLSRRETSLADELGDVLFRSTSRSLWPDPRFMQVAHRLRLVEYWRKSGKWPDFCFEPDLPYDCKAEAAKLAGRQA